MKGGLYYYYMANDGNHLVLLLLLLFLLFSIIISHSCWTYYYSSDFFFSLLILSLLCEKGEAEDEDVGLSEIKAWLSVALVPKIGCLVFTGDGWELDSGNYKSDCGAVGFFHLGLASGLTGLYFTVSVCLPWYCTSQYR